MPSNLLEHDMEFIQGQQAAPTPPQQIATTKAAETAAEMIPAGQPQSMPMGTGLAAVEPNPQETEDEPASEEEQKQYDDLFVRVMAMVHDVRKAPKGKRSLADQIIQSLASKEEEPQIVIGQTAGNLLFRKTARNFNPDMATAGKVTVAEVEGRFRIFIKIENSITIFINTIL
jgi:hypothetical protein